MVQNSEVGIACPCSLPCCLPSPPGTSLIHRDWLKFDSRHQGKKNSVIDFVRVFGCKNVCGNVRTFGLAKHHSCTALCLYTLFHQKAALIVTRVYMIITRQNRKSPIWCQLLCMPSSKGPPSNLPSSAVHQVQQVCSGVHQASFS